MNLRLIPFLLLAACASGTVKNDDPGADSDGGNFSPDDGDDSGPDDSDISDDDDDDDEEEENLPSIEDFEGDWVGDIVITSVGEEVYGWDDCEGVLELDFDDDGEVDGDGLCIAPESDWGSSEEYEVDFEGLVDAEGNVTGMLVVDAGGWGDVEIEISSHAVDEELQADGQGEVVYDGWGTEYTLTLEAEFELERE